MTAAEPTRSYRCRCERPIFFRNSECLACHAQLGFSPLTLQLRALDGPVDGTWGVDGDPVRYRRCANLEAAACNWLVSAEESATLCVSCRLDRTIPDLSVQGNGELWRVIERAKRRLVAQLLGFHLPVKSKVSEDPDRGVMFDLLRAPPGGPQVMTGHDNGLITLNIEEADDARREQIRQAMHEPYRTMLGHVRHEIGHYYWDRLVEGTAWLPEFRQRFGDETVDYAAALKKHYESPDPSWPARCVSAYASSHPWEDWAETWAHYLHMTDTMDTARSFGLDASLVEHEQQPFTLEDLAAPDSPDAQQFLALVHRWVELTSALNELSRSMGQKDFYPFVLARAVVAKLYLVHRVVHGSR